MHIVVTGGAGYIGLNLIKYLDQKGHKVTVVSRRKNLNNTSSTSNITHIQLDILNDNDHNIYQLLGEPDILIHLAWEFGFIHNEITHINNATKHIKFIENMLKGGLKHISINGTMHEIGHFVGEVTEYTPTNPQNFYGIAKNFLRKSTEILCKQYSATYQWLRIFYIYGDDINNNSIFTKLIQADKENKKSFDLNSGELLYDFIHINELVKQITSTVEQNSINGIINCCNGEPLSLKTMVNKFIKENNLSIKLNYNKYPIRPYDSRAIWGSNKKISLILNNNE